MKKIFITGASGCVGHYVLDRFLNQPGYELHLLVREPQRLRFAYNEAQVHLHIGSMGDSAPWRAVMAEMDTVIHIATDWSNSNFAVQCNVEETHKMFAEASKAKQIIYFSTASILGPNNKPLAEAEQFGTGYVRSKYLAFQQLKKEPWAAKVNTLFPTLVFGGDARHPYSHISSGLVPNLHFVKWLRFFYPRMAMHFLHAFDIATVVEYLVQQEIVGQDYVLGMDAFTGREAITEIARAFNLAVPFQIPINKTFVLTLAKLLRIEIDPWTRFCIENPRFTYQTVNPLTFNLPCAFPDFPALLANLKATSPVTNPLKK